MLFSRHIKLKVKITQISPYNYSKGEVTDEVSDLFTNIDIIFPSSGNVPVEATQ